MHAKMNEISTCTAITIATVAVVIAAGAGYVAYAFYRKKCKCKPEPPLEPLHEFMDSVGTDSIQEPEEEHRYDEKLIEEAANHMNDFVGCFESLFRAANKGSVDSCCEIITEIGNRINYFNSAPLLKLWFQQLNTDADAWNQEDARQAANKILQLLIDAGLEKDNHKKVIVDADTCTQYYHDEIERMEQGQTFNVKSPCWTYKGNVLEKGILI